MVQENHQNIFFSKKRVLEKEVMINVCVKSIKRLKTH